MSVLIINIQLFLLIKDNDLTKFHCMYPGCKRSYSRRYRLREHEKKEHGIADQTTKNFLCPFDCGVLAFRTNIQLLSHCDKEHEEKLGEIIN